MSNYRQKNASALVVDKSGVVQMVHPGFLEISRYPPHFQRLLRIRTSEKPQKSTNWNEYIFLECLDFPNGPVATELRPLEDANEMENPKEF